MTVVVVSERQQKVWQAFSVNGPVWAYLMKLRLFIPLQLLIQMPCKPFAPIP
jgi:hypothetical protein